MSIVIIRIELDSRLILCDCFLIPEADPDAGKRAVAFWS
jgi:hypothetical protein